jgi:hypothetical protein
LRGFDPLSDHLSFSFVPPEISVDRVRMYLDRRVMSERVQIVAPPRALVEGQRLDQLTFHALYEAMPLVPVPS